MYIKIHVCVLSWEIDSCVITIKNLFFEGNWIDNKIEVGMNFYRLSMTDKQSPTCFF